ncbi:MAG: alpha/beta fold hydrolase [Polyangiales bacterium]
MNKDIEIGYDSFGDERGEPLFLIMGLGAQRVFWEDAFCEKLAERGLRVIRFDNRDVGESTRLTQAHTPNTNKMLVRRLLGRSVEVPPYSLDDMAEDTFGLMDALDIDSAHVVGLSLGGMIAQCMALRKPARVRSLAIVMSGPGEVWAALPKVAALRALLTRPSDDTRETVVEHFVNSLRVIGFAPHQTPEDRIRELASIAYDRGMTGRGFQRQLGAILASPPRTRRLRDLRVPTLIVHGARDPLIPPISGRLAAAQIPGAKLAIIEGLGHDLGPSAWSYAIDAIVDNARRKLPRRPRRLGLVRAFTQKVVHV